MRFTSAFSQPPKSQLHFSSLARSSVTHARKPSMHSDAVMSTTSIPSSSNTFQPGSSEIQVLACGVPGPPRLAIPNRPRRRCFRPHSVRQSVRAASWSAWCRPPILPIQTEAAPAGAGGLGRSRPAQRAPSWGGRHITEGRNRRGAAGSKGLGQHGSLDLP